MRERLHDFLNALNHLEEYIPGADTQHLKALTHIGLNEDATTQAIAQIFGWSEPTTSRKIRAMMQAGLVSYSDEYPRKVLYLTTAGIAVLAAFARIPFNGDTEVGGERWNQVKARMKEIAERNSTPCDSCDLGFARDRCSICIETYTITRNKLNQVK